MVPFRAFDRKDKQMWVVVNYHPDAKGEGVYLAAKEDDSDDDGALHLIPAREMTQFKWVNFVEGVDE